MAGRIVFAHPPGRRLRRSSLSHRGFCRPATRGSSPAGGTATSDSAKAGHPAIHRQKAEIDGITPEESFARQAAKIPLGRIETPQEVARVAGFLLSDESSYVTGQALNVCGGLEMN